ncbi:MAG: STAS-like domain-containing protein [Bacteroidetes bacterium]|nr:STAS-like domain-containing protein [Bacteroidota bacterium]MBU2505831.1 STAS-like domain-containing protein [Bacteroidota bacterium]
MKTISVVSLLGTTALLTAEKGIELFEKIIELLKAHHESSPPLEKFILNFEGYEYVSSTFMNRSFGRLCVDKDWTVAKMKQHFFIENLIEDDMEDLELSILNARERSKLLAKGIDLRKHYASVYNY